MAPSPPARTPASKAGPLPATPPVECSGHNPAPIIPRLGFSPPFGSWGRRGECQRRGRRDDTTSVQKLGVQSGLASWGYCPNTPAQSLCAYCGDRPRAHLPEPLDLLAVLGVVPVDGVLLPVAQVYLLHAAQHQLRRREGLSGTQHQPRPHGTHSPIYSLAGGSTPHVSVGSFNSMGSPSLA